MDRDIFDGIMRGLNEAVDYQRAVLAGEEPENVRINKVTISPVYIHTKEEIKEIRANQKMTQKSFAEVLGVSVKTVEAWESGTSSPSGAANRILEMLRNDDNLFERCSIITRHTTILHEAATATP